MDIVLTGNYKSFKKSKSPGSKFSVSEFNANPEVKQLSGIVHHYLNENALPGAKFLGIKERPDEYLDNPAESIRDEMLSLTTLGARRAAINDAPENVKKAYARLLDIWENQTEIKGFGETLTATKDYAIDILTSPETYIGFGTLATGKTAIQTALRGAGAGAAWAGSDDFIRQSKDVEINRLDQISAPQVLATTAFGAAAGGILGGASHKIAKHFSDKVDPRLSNRAEAEDLEVKLAKDETVPVADKEIPKDDIDNLRDTVLEARRELELRTAQYGAQRPKDFIRDEFGIDQPDPALQFGSEIGLGIRGVDRTVRKTPAKIIKGEHRKSKPNWDGEGAAPRGAFYSRTDDTIYIDEDFLRAQFKDKPWETPRPNPDGSASGVNPLPKEFADKYLKTPDDWIRFVEIHEKAHTEFVRRKAHASIDVEAIEGRPKYENRINEITMLEMRDPRLYPTPAVKKLNKEYGGGGSRTDEELNDIINSTMLQLEGQSDEVISNALKFETTKFANNFPLISQLIFKPASLLDSFTKYSTVAKSLQQKFRYDTQRELFGPRTYDKQDFGEVFKEILGDNYVTFKEALHPIQSTMSGKLELGFNNLLRRALTDPDKVSLDQFEVLSTSYKEIRTLLDNIGDELLETGVIRNKVENNYFPRLWNRKAIEKNIDDFKDRLVKIGEAKNLDEADEIATNMLNKNNQLDQGGGGGGAGFFYNRVFKTKGIDDAFSDYLDTDINSVMLNYIAQSSKAIAKRKVFGVNNLDEFTNFYINGIDAQMQKAGKSLTLKDKKKLQKLYNHATGENLNRFEGAAGLTVDIYSTINRMAYLPLATISSLTEIFINVAKAGPTSTIKGLMSALNTSRGTIQDKSLQLLKKKGLTEKEAWRELQEFGMALDPVLVDTVERLSGSLVRNQTLQKINNAFFRVTFLDQWTKFVQLASYKTGKDLIGKNLREINKLVGAPDSRRIRNMKDQLNELGVDIDQGLKWINEGEALDDPFYKNIKRGAARYTNEVILMPTGESGLKPFWTGDPKTSILFQFLGYPIAFTNTVLKNAAKDIIRNPVQNAPKTLAAGLIMTEVARWTNWARSHGKSEENKSQGEIYTAAIRRWGGNGIVEDLWSRGVKAAEVYQDPIAMVSTWGGPVGNDLYKIIKRGDLVRIMGEKIPGYGALGFVSPEAKKAYAEWLKEQSKESREGFLETFNLKREVQPARLNRAEGGEAREEYIFGGIIKGATKLAKAGIKKFKKEPEPSGIDGKKLIGDMQDLVAELRELREIRESNPLLNSPEEIKFRTYATTTKEDFKKSDEYKYIVDTLGSDNAEGAGYSISKKEIDAILASKGPKGVLEQAYGSPDSSYFPFGKIEYKKVKDAEANFLLKVGLDPVTVRRITDEDEFPSSVLNESEKSIRKKVAIRFGYSSYRENPFAEPRKPGDTEIIQDIDPESFFNPDGSWAKDPKFRPPMAKGGEVDVPNAASEPDERIDRMTGLPYNLQAGIPFRDEEDPIKRLGLAGGGRASTPMQRLGFERGGFLKDLAGKAQSTAAIGDEKQMAIAKKLGFTEENIRAATAFGNTYGEHTQVGGKGDAARHIMLGWAAAQTENPNVALKIINARDYVLGIPGGEGVLGIGMDVHNNQIGFSIGGSSREEAQEQAKAFIESGQAKTIR